MIDKQILSILRCPVDRSTLVVAEESLVARVNRGIAAGNILNVGGNRLEKPIDGGLVRQAGDLLYPIVDDIPVLLPDEAIDVAAVEM